MKQNSITYIFRRRRLQLQAAETLSDVGLDDEFQGNLKREKNIFVTTNRKFFQDTVPSITEICSAMWHHKYAESNITSDASVV
jgi:hypothetical protein